MSDWREMTVGDVIDGLKRYQPIIAATVVIVLIVTLLPGRDQDEARRVVDAPDRAIGAFEERDFAADPTDPSVRVAGAQGTRPGEAAPAPAAPFGLDAQPGEDFVPGANCDPARGRIMVPAVFAPPCAPAFDGQNGGATYPGVSGDTIRIGVYDGETNPVVQTILAGAGADDSDEEVFATHQGWANYFETHYETYGRRFELVPINGGADDDDVAAQAAAREAIDAGIFASIGGPSDTNVYMRELASAGILCICTVSQPIEVYLEHAPFVWSTLMSSTQLYIHRAEYIGKRLAGDRAVHAGDATYHLRERTFAIVYFDTAEGTYTAGVDFFEQELRRYGVQLSDRIAVTGAHIDPAAAQQQAGQVAQRLRDNQITSVLFAGDPLYPIFLTQEATLRGYFPEWIITGSVLSDTTFFARTYSPEQWQNAFGLSALTARLQERRGEAHRLYTWHHGRDPEAEATYGIIYGPWWILGTGVHMAGPNLGPETFRNGMFAYPPTGGGPTTAHTSFGHHVWDRWPTYLRFDDTTEIWWDRTSSGEDEIGQLGVGMYRYVDGGRRYLAGEWPSTPPAAFVTEGTVLIYDELPPEDAYPDYPPPR